ncbi:unnamed protein product [Rhodiola kirilowii]
MALRPKLLHLRLPLIFLIVTLIGPWPAESLAEVDALDSPLRIELDQLRSRIFILETKISERAEELKIKDDNIKDMEKIIKEKSDYIASLYIQIEALQIGSPEAEKLKSKMYARLNELRNQAGNLRNEIQAQIKKKDDLKVRILTAEKQIRELNLKLESLRKISDEQRTGISKIKHGIQRAEVVEWFCNRLFATMYATDAMITIILFWMQEKLVKLKIEATLVSDEMNQIYGGWVPPWLAASVDGCLTYIIALWTKQGRPRLGWAIQRAMHVKAIVQAWACPHIKAIKKTWIPKMKRQWSMFTIYLEPRYVEFRDTTNPYIQEAKQILKPYLTQISVTSTPHFDRLTRALKLYRTKFVQTYERLMRSVMAHHTQVQDMISELLTRREYTRPLVDKDIVWYLASAIYALPAILIVNLYASIASNKSQKQRHKRHARRRAKRLRPEN